MNTTSPGEKFKKRHIKIQRNCSRTNLNRNPAIAKLSTTSYSNAHGFGNRLLYYIITKILFFEEEKKGKLRQTIPFLAIFNEKTPTKRFDCLVGRETISTAHIYTYLRYVLIIIVKITMHRLSLRKVIMNPQLIALEVEYSRYT